MFVSCKDCEYVSRRAKATGELENIQKCQKNAPEANRAADGLALVPRVELHDDGCHEGKEVNRNPGPPKTKK